MDPVEQAMAELNDALTRLVVVRLLLRQWKSGADPAWTCAQIDIAVNSGIDDVQSTGN